MPISRWLFEQYQSFLDNVRCICRNMIERGFKSCCKPSEAETKAQMQMQSLRTWAVAKQAEKGCCKPSAKPTADGKAGCCSTDRVKGKRQCCNNSQEPRCSQNGEKLPDDCCSGKKRTNDCCNGKTKSEAVEVNQGLDRLLRAPDRKQKSVAVTRMELMACVAVRRGLSCSTDGSPPASCRDECCGGAAKRYTGSMLRHREAVPTPKTAS